MRLLKLIVSACTPADFQQWGYDAHWVAVWSGEGAYLFGLVLAINHRGWWVHVDQFWLFCWLVMGYTIEQYLDSELPPNWA